MFSQTVLRRNAGVLALCAALAWSPAKAETILGLTGSSQGHLTLVSIETSTAAAVPLMNYTITASLLPTAMTYYPPFHQLLLLCRGGNSEPVLVTLDPIYGRVVERPVTGLPPDSLEVSGIEYHRESSSIYITYGLSGTALENGMAKIDYNGQVLCTSGDLGLWDRDLLAADPPLCGGPRYVTWRAPRQHPPA